MLRAILALIEAVAFLIVTLPVLLILMIIQHFNRKAAERVSRSMVSFALNLIGLTVSAHVHIKGMENIPGQEPVLFIGNHLSIFDIILVYPRLKRPVGYVAKKELKHIPVFGAWMRLIECTFLDRSDIKQALLVINESIGKIKSGISIFIFPEGTRSKTGEVAEFKAGSFKIATRTGCPIVPVAIKHTNEIIRTHMPFIKTTDVYVEFGKPVEISSLDREGRKKLHESVRETIISMQEKMP